MCFLTNLSFVKTCIIRKGYGRTHFLQVNSTLQLCTYSESEIIIPMVYNCLKFVWQRVLWEGYVAKVHSRYRELGGRMVMV